MSDVVVHAATTGDLETLRTLIQARESLDTPGRGMQRLPSGREVIWYGPPLIGARDHPEVVALLLDGGASIEVRDDEGRTPLHRATADGLVATVKLLLARGADPNARDRTERTPLHFVCFARNDDDGLEVAKLLIASGADPRAKNNLGKTPGQTGYANDARTFLQKEARKKPASGTVALESAARASLRSDLERRIDDACRTIGRTVATHDHARHRDDELLVFLVGKHEFARIDRNAAALDVRDGHEWRAIPYAALPDDPGELSAIIATSLAEAKTPRMPIVELVRIHPILKGAHEKATPEERPAEPAHLGGETPVCPSAGAVRIILWMAERARDVSQPPDARALALLLEQAHDSLEAPDKGAYGNLLAASKDKRSDSPALGVARRAVGAASTLLKGKHDVVWVHGKAAAARLVPILRHAGASVADFLRDLDQKILCAEMAAVAVRQGKASSDFVVERVLWRGPDLWLGRLPPTSDGMQRYALTGKLGRRWTLLVGTRDDMLASIPDFAFEAATTALRPS